MDSGCDLLQLLREALAEGEAFDASLREAGWHSTRDVNLRAFLWLVSGSMPHWSDFFIKDGELFRGGELVYRRHPNMPIKVMAYEEIWLPPSQTVVNKLWADVARLASEQPNRFLAALLNNQEVDDAYNVWPPQG